MELMEAIKARKSMRRLKEDQVPRELLEYVLEAARLAPSWHNKQGWFYLVLTGESRKLAANAVPDKNPAKNALAQSPVNIILCADPAESGCEDGKDYYLVDAALSMQQLMLAAADKGLGTCWVAGWLDEKYLKETFNIPGNLRVVGITPLGYPAYEPKPRPRKEIREIAFLNEWGKEF
ncbi:MAG: nitroreductase family protein [Bacillota bacterium]